MSVFTVPNFVEGEAWPTLGPQVCAFIERHYPHGPGDLRGQAVHLDEEKRALIYSLYEVYPRPANGCLSAFPECGCKEAHPQAGRRRYKRAGLSVRKGSAKTELAGWITACELDPEAPVRCIGWDENGQPIGGPVTDPYIPMLAYTETQSEELAYGALYVIVQKSTRAHLFDIGLERVMRVAGDGKAEAIATAPNAADGARTTFQVFDETHRFTLQRHRNAHQVMLRNIPKRKLADAWSLEITTAFAPGQGSVAEQTMAYARAVHEGRVKDTRLFFFHRQAGEEHKIDTAEGLRAAVIDASGPAIAPWSDIDGICSQFQDPEADRTYLERTWLNRPKRSADHAFDSEVWKGLAKPGYVAPKGSKIVIGFDGSKYLDATALIAEEIETAFQWPLGIWERPFDAEKDWEVDEAAVDAVLEAAMEDYDVWRVYADPPYWETLIAAWSGKYGEERVIKWLTNRDRKMADAVRAYRQAQLDGHLSHNGNAQFARHVANCFKKLMAFRDDQDQPMFTVQKERKDSPNKIDAAVAGMLANEARRDALELGVGKKSRSKYEDEDPRVLDVEELLAAEERAKREQAPEGEAGA